MTFPDFSITLKLEENTKFIYLYTTSSAEPDVSLIVFIIKPAVKNWIIWKA